MVMTKKGLTETEAMQLLRRAYQVDRSSVYIDPSGDIRCVSGNYLTTTARRKGDRWDVTAYGILADQLDF